MTYKPRVEGKSHDAQLSEVNKGICFVVQSFVLISCL